MKNFKAFEFGLFCLLIGFCAKLFLGNLIGYGIMGLGGLIIIYSFK